jgi:hypothetical protein
MGTELESVYAQEGTMQDVLARCLKKTEAQVCTSTNIREFFVKRYPTFLSSMLTGKSIFKIYIAQYVHGIITNDHCRCARIVFV